MIYVRRVVGKSMDPVLLPGKMIIAVRSHRYEVGDIIVFIHENKEKIKRITKDSGHEVWVEGDNPEFSKDSRHFGWVPKKAIKGKMRVPKNTL